LYIEQCLFTYMHPWVTLHVKCLSLGCFYILYGTRLGLWKER
jgi:hypothetical protein